MTGAGAEVSSITPNPIDLASPPATFTIAGNGFANLGFGLPVVNFARNGLAIAQARATSTTGTTLTVPFPTNATSIGGPRPGLSAGPVTVEVYNQSGSSSFSLIGTTPLTVNDTRAAPQCQLNYAEPDRPSFSTRYFHHQRRWFYESRLWSARR